MAKVRIVRSNTSFQPRDGDANKHNHTNAKTLDKFEHVGRVW